MTRVALIFDDQVRPDTTGVYCLRALQGLTAVDHFLPADLGRVPRTGYDLYLNIDDGLEYRLPPELRPCAWWAIDTHLNPSWCRERARDFDWVFAAQRDGAELMLEAGIASACWLPLACDPDVHRKYDAEKRFDVCFVGHVCPGPRADLLDLLQRRFRDSFVGQRFFEEMARVYSASRLVFNRSIRNDVNMRVFEALACGSLLLTNDLSDNGQAELFQDGVHLATYRDAEELLDKAAYYLDRPAVRERIAAAGRAEVLARDTYRHRMEKLLAEVEKGLAATKVCLAGTPEPGAAQRPSSPAHGPDPQDTVESAVLALIPPAARKLLAIGRQVGGLADALRARPGAEVLTLDLPAEGDLDAECAKEQSGSQAVEVVVCLRLLEYLSEPGPFLRGVKGWLAPEGELIALLPNVRQHPVLRGLLDGHWAAEPGQVGFFTRREVEKLFFRAGFTVRDLQAVPGIGYDAWQQGGGPGEVKIGRLHVGGLSSVEAEEFFAAGYLVRATPARVPDAPLTSIVVVAHNQLAYTRRCLDSVRRFTDEPYELIVVDNGSSDGTPEYLPSRPGVQLIANADNRGFPAAANQGIRAARGQQVLLLNNDCVVTTGWLTRLLAALGSAPDVGLAGPCSNFVSGAQHVAVGYEEDLLGLDGFAWDWGKANDGVREDTDRLVGFCLLARRELVDRIGLLDERFGVGCFEDDDYGRRALRAGYRLVIARDAFVHHFGGRTFLGTRCDFAALMAKNRQLFEAKWQEEAPAEVPAAPAEWYTLRQAPAGGLLLERVAVRLSLCMIVRDNARTIEACLASIRPWVDEMVVVDTGSSDDTPQLARRLGARVYHFPWCDDFSAARNESLKYARGEWVFWMDSDDTIDPDCGAKLRALAGREPSPELLGYVMQVHCPGPGEDGPHDVTVVDHVKLFRNRPDLRFDGRIHEQILPAIHRAGGEVAFTDLFVTHAGYDHSPQGQKKKLERDLRILHRELAERPDHPFTLFNLGMTYADAKDYDKALDFLWRSIEHSGPRDSHVRKAYALVAHCESTRGRPEAAWEACRKGLRLFPQDAELRFRRGVVLHELGRLREAVAAYEDLLEAGDERHFSSLDRGLTGFKARHNLAVVHGDLGELAAAEAQWRRVAEEQPGYHPGWRGLGDVLLRQGNAEEALAVARRLLADEHLRQEGTLLKVKALALGGRVPEARREIAAIVGQGQTDLAALHDLCRFLFEQVDPGEGEGVLREILRRDPRDAAASHNLGTLCRRQGRPGEAAEAFQKSVELRPDSPATWSQLAEALREGGRLPEARQAWEQVLRLTPGDPAATEALRHAEGESGPPSEQPTRRDAPATPRKYTLALRERTTEVLFAVRGPVDRAILQEVWERDVYGVRGLADSPATVVDMGAHIGAFALMAAEAWPAARVVACEADAENFALLRHNLAGYPTVELVEAAVVGEDVPEVEFHAVRDKANGNSGGGSYARSEPDTQTTRVPALFIGELWRSKGLASCDLLKLDCEGAEAGLLRVLAEAGLLAGVGRVVGEWHAADGRRETAEDVKRQLRAVLGPTHEITFNPHRAGREGRFSATALALPRLADAHPPG
jgi:FkbM family methyltransferase